MNPTLTTISTTPIALSRSDSQSARRRHFDQDKLDELTESIREHGVLQPIIVREDADGYELIAGERRLLAARAANLEELPAVVYDEDLSESLRVEIQMIENLQRADLHPMEEAEGYQQLIRSGQPVDELHSRVGKSKSYVYSRLKLLDLCQPARDAFYDGTISSSIALLVARIPVDKLQKEFLKAVLNEYGGPSYKRAHELLLRRYMLGLKDAPFPTDDAALVKAAGPCGLCPKRTGNQAEIFGDVKSADTCTDPDCFGKKVREHGKRVLRDAEKNGQETIVGAAAKKLFHYGHIDSSSGYVKLSATIYDDTKSRTAKQILGKDANPTLLQDPETGGIIEIVKRSAVMKAIGKRASRKDNGERVRKQKAKIERAFRIELFDQLRPRLPMPDLRDVAVAMFNETTHDTRRELCRIRGFEAPKTNEYGTTRTNYNAIGDTIPQLTKEEAGAFLQDMIYAGELTPSAWSDQKPERLLTAAKQFGLDVEAIRLAVTPAKKPAAKKVRSKRASKKTATRGGKR